MDTTGFVESSKNPFAYLRRCLDVGEREMACALGSRRAFGQLLERLATIARPKEGAPKIFLIFARLAAENGGWLEGKLRIDVVADCDRCILQARRSALGGELEAIAPDMVFDVPIEEFLRALERAPQVIGSLAIRWKGARTIVLAAPDCSVETTELDALPLLSLDGIDSDWDV